MDVLAYMGMYNQFLKKLNALKRKWLFSWTILSYVAKVFYIRNTWFWENRMSDWTQIMELKGKVNHACCHYVIEINCLLREISSFSNCLYVTKVERSHKEYSIINPLI